MGVLSGKPKFGDMQMSDQAQASVVQTRREGDVLVVSINNPPVNALGQAVRAGLLAAVEQAESDAAVKAVLIVGEGKAFIAGADIRVRVVTILNLTLQYYRRKKI
jgi:3-hydroxyacyl-CoA dehydrogenase